MYSLINLGQLFILTPLEGELKMVVLACLTPNFMGGSSQPLPLAYLRIDLRLGTRGGSRNYVGEGVVFCVPFPFCLACSLQYRLVHVEQVFKREERENTLIYSRLYNFLASRHDEKLAK